MAGICLATAGRIVIVLNSVAKRRLGPSMPRFTAARHPFLLKGSVIAAVLGVIVLALFAKWSADRKTCFRCYDLIQLGMPPGIGVSLAKSQNLKVVILDDTSFKAYPCALPACYVFAQARSNVIAHVSVRSSDRFDDIWKQKNMRLQ